MDSLHDERLRFDLENQRIAHQGITEYAAQLQRRLVEAAKKLRELRVEKPCAKEDETNHANGSEDLVAALREQTDLIRSLEAHVEAARTQQCEERKAFTQTLSELQQEGKVSANHSKA